MKKLFVVLLMAVAFCGSAEAQKGMKGIGVNINGINSLVSGETSLGFGVKFQYNLSDYMRIEPSFTYYFANELENVYKMTVLANMHFFFSAPKAFRPYLFIGGGDGSICRYRSSYVFGSGYSYSYDDEAGLVLNGGLGLDWRLSHKLSLQTEVGLMFGVDMEDSNGLKFNMGLSYNF